ncbi:hypothetical protein B296_00036586 [Ensete ventricosum]|uniref:Uncharacterized protein n=1 Tax=Ensete ventricosum TaxID=4639 RepID=A0A426XKA7_ENSVE|nr:hypothetical protein B296_00036586 [Ensete ventricosum]
MFPIWAGSTAVKLYSFIRYTAMLPVAPVSASRCPSMLPKNSITVLRSQFRGGEGEREREREKRETYDEGKCDPTPFVSILSFVNDELRSFRSSIFHPPPRSRFSPASVREGGEEVALQTRVGRSLQYVTSDQCRGFVFHNQNTVLLLDFNRNVRALAHCHRLVVADGTLGHPNHINQKGRLLGP